MTDPEAGRVAGGTPFALVGEVGGTFQICVLRPGPNTVGRGSSCDIRVAVAGVSQRHAAVDVGRGHVTVRDLASKNGTYVRGRRAAQARAKLGDEIRFGPSVFTLEEVEPDDAWLGVTARTARRRRGTKDSDSPTSTVVWTGAVDSLAVRRWLRLVDDLTAELSVSGEASIEHALAVLVRGLEAQAGVLLRRDESAALVEASVGELPSELPAKDIERVLEGAEEKRRPVVLEVEGDPSWLVVGGRGERLVLALAGGSADALGTALARTAHGLLSLRLGRGPRPARAQPAGERELRFPPGYLPGRSPVMKPVYEQMVAVADSALPVLLVGETGVGKECLARTLHRSSNRADEVFLPVNCAAIPSELLEAELFGIGKGVATGVDKRAGRFSLADRGTLFLDEIGDMSLGLQAKLLRVLEEGLVRPVGGGAETVDVRVVAATNTELEQRVDEGAFRRDLYYRLAGMVVVVPPLRQRGEDLAGLVEQFFFEACDEAEKDLPGITYGAMRELASRRWPGNIRQLRHVVQRLVFLAAPGRPIDSKLVTGSNARDLTDADARSPRRAVAGWESLELAVAERALIAEALERAAGNRSQAARLLGISRQALHRRLKSFDRE